MLERTGPDALGPVRSVVTDRENKINVADGQAREIRAFDPEGQLLWTIVRGGAGPSELRNLVGIAWVGETLAVTGPSNGRVFARCGADGPHDTLPGMDPPPDTLSLDVLCRGEGFFTFVRFPSAPELMTAFAEEGRGDRLALVPGSRWPSCRPAVAPAGLPPDS